MSISTNLKPYTFLPPTSGLVFALWAWVVAAPVTRAQEQLTGGSLYVEAWVDPCDGNDVSGSGQKVSPFRTLQKGIDAIQNFSNPFGKPLLVHANPGVYSPDTNGENLPVVLRPGVNVQGVGARQCILRGTRDGTDKLQNVVWPEDTGGEFPRQAREVLLDLRQAQSDETQTGGEDEMFDGFTFQGGDIQVYLYAETNIQVHVSNCIFDMLYNPHPTDPAPLTGCDNLDVDPFNPFYAPTFGVLVVRSLGQLSDITTYETYLGLFNNTFLMMHVSPRTGGTYYAQHEAIALCNTSYPRSLGQGIGYADLNVQNNLFYVSPNPPSPNLSMLGVSKQCCQVGTGPVVNTNAFASSSLNNNTSFFAQTEPPGSLPVPAVNLEVPLMNEVPFFVGEWIDAHANLATSLGLPPQQDWRLLPDSIVKDKGVQPIGFPVPGSLLQAGNGSTYIDPGVGPGAHTALSSFDFDGEGYGNARVFDIRPDCGADETGWLIDVGTANGTIIRTPPAGNGTHFMMFRSPGQAQLVGTTVPVPAQPPAYTILPGSVDPPTEESSYPPQSKYYFSSAGVTACCFSVNGFPATPYGVLIQPAVTTNHYANVQARFQPTGTSTLLLTNMQSSID